MKVLSAGETGERLPYTKLAGAIREVALTRREAAAQAPERLVVPLPRGGALLAMPAADADLAITKLVTVHPENAERGLPTIQGEVMVMEAATGRRLGLLDGAVVTGRRTAALSLLAARTLARDPAGPLLVVGAGTQGHAHLEAFREGLGVEEVYVTSRTRASAERLAEHARSLGMEARVVDVPEAALGEVSLVVTATTSTEPVLPESLPDGVFVAAVGAFKPEMAELPPALVSRSAVVVDTLEGAREEAGDLIQAAEAGAFRWENALQLEDVLRGERPSGWPVVFKSVGHALWDLAAARAAFGG
jgi:1-piperideine-2-carboxylate/1-pyrroline-2-carboxylate reductase [NAD(P)H]